MDKSDKKLWVCHNQWSEYKVYERFSVASSSLKYPQTELSSMFKWFAYLAMMIHFWLEDERYKKARLHPALPCLLLRLYWQRIWVRYRLSEDTVIYPQKIGVASNIRLNGKLDVTTYFDNRKHSNLVFKASIKLSDMLNYFDDTKFGFTSNVITQMFIKLYSMCDFSNKFNQVNFDKEQIMFAYTSLFLVLADLGERVGPLTMEVDDICHVVLFKVNQDTVAFYDCNDCSLYSLPVVDLYRNPQQRFLTYV